MGGKRWLAGSIIQLGTQRVATYRHITPTGELDGK